jgi:hypothetical protein
MSLIKMHLDQFLKDMDKANDQRVAIGQAAVRAEGYRLWKLLRTELKAGAPGGSALEPLREISQWSGQRKPLSALWRAVRYKVHSKSPLRMEIGAADTRAERRSTEGIDALGGMGRAWARSGLSASWVTLFAKQQAGFRTPVTEQIREFLAGIGGALSAKKGKAKGRARYFFLRKETTEFVTPARDIIDAFWRSHLGEMERNMRTWFNEKIAKEMDK